MCSFPFVNAIGMPPARLGDSLHTCYVLSKEFCQNFLQQNVACGAGSFSSTDCGCKRKGREMKIRGADLYTF